MTDTFLQDRWTELEFFYICSDIYSFRNNIMDVMDIIDSLAIIGGYMPEQIKPLAQEVLASIRYRPAREEFIILCHKQGVPIRDIKERTGLHNRTLYQLLEDEKTNPRLFYPRFSPMNLSLIRQFVDCFNKFKKVGLS